MSKSLARVAQALKDANVEAEIMEMSNATRTAADAAREAGCHVDQIAKSIIFRGAITGRAVLFITAGGQRVDPHKAEALANEALERADAAFVRAFTGFAIGGVSPIGHLTPPKTFFDPRLMEFDRVYAAAGTPHHIFPIDPHRLCEISDAQLSDFIHQSK